MRRTNVFYSMIILGLCPTGINLFSSPRSYIRSIRANNVALDVNSFQDNTTGGYTFPRSARDYSITVEFNLPLLVDRFAIVQRSNPTNVDAYDVTLDQSPEYPIYAGRIGSLSQADSTDTDRSFSLTFRINQTSDGQPPRNVILYIEGCDFTTVVTKAQIESATTTTISGSLIGMKDLYSSYLFSYLVSNH